MKVPLGDAVSHRSSRLLVADDDEGLLFLIAEALRGEGWEVEPVASGEVALTWLGGHNADLLLLDLKLGDIPALELVERLRASGREAPFIIVTGHGDERTAVEAMKQGALDYVMKDAGMLELLPSIVRRSLAVVEREKRLAEAREAVRQREERYQHVIQTALDGFVRFDRDGRLIEVNRALSELLGWPEEKWFAGNAFSGDGAPFREDIRNHAGRLNHRDAARLLTRVVRRDGTEVEVEISLRCEGGELFGFVHDISQQRRLEREITQATLDERRRVGQELHDGLGQQLTALELMTHLLARELKPIAPAQAKAASEITNYIRRAVAQTRELAHDLSPISEEGEGLMEALRELARMTTLTGIPCDFQCEQPVIIEDRAVAAHLHRIAQEAVTNALKHAKARHIHLQLEDRGASIALSIKDDGRGLRQNKSNKEGMGLQVIQHRSHLIGGSLTLESEAGKGMLVVCSIPKPS